MSVNVKPSEETVEVEKNRGLTPNIYGAVSLFSTLPVFPICG